MSVATLCSVAYLPKDLGVLVLPFVFLFLLTDGLIL